MKKYEEIKKEIAKNQEAKKANLKKIDILDFTKEKDAILHNEKGTFFTNLKSEAYKALTEKAEANREQINKLYDEIYMEEVKERILLANARNALFFEGIEVIKAAFMKYNGKPYGEKTRAKIREEVHAAGYSYYFNDYEIEVQKLTPAGYTNGENAKAATMNEEHHTTSILDENNKIQIDKIVFYPRDKYEENPTKAAREAVKAIRAYTKATQEIRKQAEELREKLPAGIHKPDYISEYKVTF